MTEHEMAGWHHRLDGHEFARPGRSRLRECGRRAWRLAGLSSALFSLTPLPPHYPGTLSITNSQNPPKPTSIELVTPSNHLMLCHPLLLLPSIFPSNAGVGSLSLYQWIFPTQGSNLGLPHCMGKIEGRRRRG